MKIQKMYEDYTTNDDGIVTQNEGDRFTVDSGKETLYSGNDFEEAAKVYYEADKHGKFAYFNDKAGYFQQDRVNRYVNHLRSLEEDASYEWKPNTSFKHIKAIYDKVKSNGYTYANNEREEFMAAVKKAENKGYKPEQCRQIKDWHRDIWQHNRNKSTNESMNEATEDYVTRYKVEYRIDEFDDEDTSLEDYIFADSKKECEQKIKKQYPNAIITACIPEQVPARYKMNESSNNIDEKAVESFLTKYGFDDYYYPHIVTTKGKDIEISFTDGIEAQDYKLIDKYAKKHFNDEVSITLGKKHVDSDRLWATVNISTSSDSLNEDMLFYNNYIISKNKAGEGFDILSYDGTPEKITKTYIEDEGYATIKDAKAEIDKWYDEAMNESSNRNYNIKFYQIFEAPNSPTENGKMIGQRGTLDSANAFGKRVAGKGKYIIKAVCDDGQTRYVDNDLKESAYEFACPKCGEETGDELETDAYGNKTFRCASCGYDSQKADEWKPLEEASYGGAYDIEDDQYFTKDELMDFAEEVCEHLNETFDEMYDIEEVYMNGKYIELTVISSNGDEFSTKKRVDMRAIRKPSDIDKFVLTVASELIKQVKEYSGTSINEGYNVGYKIYEDIETPTLEGPVEGPKAGLSSLINEATQEEFKTIDTYNSIALTARAEGYEDIAKVIDEINTEENKHVGQLQELLKILSPNAQAIDIGEAEGQNQLTNV